MIELKFASVEYTDFGAVSYFNDGAVWGATPHQTRHYYVIAHRLGYGDDVMAYCREHEFAHHLITQWLYDAPSPILWGLAHNVEVPAPHAVFEELAAQSLQRFLRAGERPIIGGVDWDALREHAFELLDPMEVTRC